MAERALVRGIADVGSAVAHALAHAAHPVAIQDAPQPTTHRRGMSFAEAMFDGEATLEGPRAHRIDSPGQLAGALAERDLLPVTAIVLERLLEAPGWEVLVPHACANASSRRISAVWRPW
jgi:hypothetical protein